MKKTDKRTLTPRLRFPEFRNAEEWLYQPLGEVSDIRTGPFGSTLHHSDYVNVGTPIVTVEHLSDYGLVHNNLPLVSDDDRERLANYSLRQGDIVFSRVGSVDRNSLVRKEEEGWLFSGRLLRIRANVNDANPAFLSFYFQLEKTKQKIRSVAVGQTMPSLNTEILNAFPVLFASPAEQQKIADCLTSLDALIAAEGRKLEALRAHKKGLMQQLFPRPGKSRPRLRFPEFHNAGEWETTTLDQLVDIRSGGTPSKANPAFWHGSIPWVSAKDMKRLFLEDTEDHISIAAVDDGARLVPTGTLLMLTRGMTLLKDVPICILSKEMSFNQDVKALRPKADVDGLFLAFSLLGNKQRLLKMVDIAGHGTGKLNTDEIEAFELASPQPAEQQRIAACLSSLDKVLAAQSRKVEALKQHKKGLMQQLFPSSEGG